MQFCFNIVHYLASKLMTFQKFRMMICCFSQCGIIVTREKMAKLHHALSTSVFAGSNLVWVRENLMHWLDVVLA